MKSIKRMSCLLLALALMASILAVPASAANHTRTDQGKGNGYSWNSYLTSNDTSVTASITVRANDTGSTPANLSAKTFGSARTKDNTLLSLDHTEYVTAQEKVTAAITQSTTAANPIEYVMCAFYAQGIQAGNTASYYT